MKETAKQTKEDSRYSTLLWHRLTRVYRANLGETTQLLKDCELSPAQMDVLGRIAENKNLSQQELANKLLVTKGNIAQLIKKLEELHYIEREKIGKTNYLTLTPEGQAKYVEMLPLLSDFQDDFFSVLNQTEKKEMLRLLKKIQP